jgi:exopolyphosphatase/pppGpp-phosphohydrolase
MTVMNRMRRHSQPLWICLLVLGALLGPLAAARAEMHGGIEIGSKGVKATVVDVLDGDDFDLQIKLTDTTNTALVLSLSKDGHFADEPLADTVRAVKKYYDRFRKEFGVAPERIHIVGSSGLFTPIEDKADLVKENREKLWVAVMKETGVTMTFIDVKREAELSIAGIIPKNHRGRGALVDIGGGNTKGGYMLEGGKYATFGIPYATLTFSEFAKKKGASGKAVCELAAETLRPLLKKEFAGLPELTRRDPVYLSGGIIWAVAIATHPLDARSFVRLTLKDVEDFQAKLLADPSKYPEPDLSGAKDDKARLRAMAEIARAKKVYTPEQMLGGVEVLKSVLQELGPERHTFFARHGHLGWLLAYLTEATGG